MTSSEWARFRRRTWRLAPPALVVLVPLVALAGEPSGAAQERHSERHGGPPGPAASGERRGHARPFGSAAPRPGGSFFHGRAPDGGPPSAEDRAEFQKFLAARLERQQKHRMEIQRRWGPLLAAPGAFEELRLHARRMARLHRMLTLAERREDGDGPKLVARINALITKEDGRHDLAMQRLGPPAPSASGALAVPPASAGAR
jgi:hypothetical protein